MGHWSIPALIPPPLFEVMASRKRGLSVYGLLCTIIYYVHCDLVSPPEDTGKAGQTELPKFRSEIIFLSGIRTLNHPVIKFETGMQNLDLKSGVLSITPFEQLSA